MFLVSQVSANNTDRKSATRVWWKKIYNCCLTEEAADMGRDSELFKAAKTGNTAFLERMFASYLKKNTHSHVFGSGLGR